MLMSGIRSDTALLVTGSPSLALGLRALLLSVPPIEHVDRVANMTELLMQVAEVKPSLVILDGESVGRALAELLPTLCDLSPDTRSLILSDHPSDMDGLPVKRGVNVVLKGLPADRLARAIEDLLAGPRQESA